MKLKIRIRKKGNYYVIEKIHEGKILKSLTLNPEKVWNMLTCQPQNKRKVSEIKPETITFEDQKCAQDTLNVSLKQGESLTQGHERRRKDFFEGLSKLSPEQIKKLEEANKEVKK